MTEPPHRSRIVFVIEDDADIAEACVEALSLDGFHALSFSDGLKALERARIIDRIDVVVLDLMMPNMNGVEFLDAMARDPRLSIIPVVVITADPQAETRVAGYANVRTVIHKPFALDRLTDSVREIFPNDDTLAESTPLT